MSQSYLYGNTGSTNFQIGVDALQNVTSGTNNTVFGSESYKFLTTGSFNSGFGYAIANNAAGNPASTSIIGSQTLQGSATTPSCVVSAGLLAGNTLTDGSNNVLFGSNSTPTLIDGFDNALFGAFIDTFNSDVDSAVVIGSSSAGMTFGYTDTIIGRFLINSTSDNNILIGFESEIDEADGNVVIGNNSGGASDFFINDNIIIGHDFTDIPPGSFGSIGEALIFGNDIGDFGFIFDLRVFGYEAAGNTGSGAGGECIGYQAGQNDPNISITTYVGFRAGRNSDNTTVAMGAFASEFATGTLEAALGFQSMQNIGGDRSCACGYQAMRGSAAPGVPDVGAGTAVGAGKLASITKTLDATSQNPELADFDFTGATTASLGGTYFELSGFATDYYVWYNVDGLSIDPGPIGLRTAVEVSLSSGFSAATIASTTASVIGFLVGMTDCLGSNAYLIDVTNTVNGDVTDIAPGTFVAPPIGGIAVTKLMDGTVGTPEVNRIDFGIATPFGLLDRYFLISSATTDYYVWFSVNGVGTDPAIVGRTGLQVNLFSSASTSFIRTAVRNALNGTGEFSAVNMPNTFLRMKVTAFASFNAALGARAYINCAAGEDNLVIGVDAAPSLIAGSQNTVIGKDADVPAGSEENTVIGNAASVSGNNTRCTVVGRGASSTGDESVVFGAEAATALNNAWQFGKATVLGTARMKFQNQIVSDEAWIGGGLSFLRTDASGNFVRGISVDNIATTTDATPTIIYTLPTIATDTSARLEALVLGRRTGGGAGAVNDTAAYVIKGAVKNVGGSIFITAPTVIIVEDQPAWNAEIFNNGIDTVVVVRVIGAAMNNISWEARVRILL